MKTYVELDEDEIGDEGKIKRMLLELDEEGAMRREIGLDERGLPIHIAPFGGERGIFDLVAFEESPSALSAEEFQKIWNDAVEAKSSIQ